MNNFDYARAIIGALLFVVFVKFVLEIHWYFAFCFVVFIYMVAFWSIDIFNDVQRRRQKI